ncbi:MAG: 4-diphosphocytidyl-2C-methyl-D-erythritol kinase [Fretibacterium sp.]|nr:4-diphosphocytidyl-2C-methyl-D-erythritol kinase [Fretibacterium sp.]
MTSKREDGYHDLVSLFLRIPSMESLRITPLKQASCDRVRTLGLEIEGENILLRALRLAREAGFSVPFLDVEIQKNLPPGSGLGAGSGNGAALLQWLAANTPSPVWQQVARSTGADVSFLFSGAPLALVSGIGDVIEPLPCFPLSALVVFPGWKVGTKNAYGELDERCGGVYSKKESEARSETDALYKALVEGRPCGFLPNDLASALLERFPRYSELFVLFEELGYHAWGITGSGSAAFALSPKTRLPEVPWPSWVEQVIFLPSLF